MLDSSTGAAAAAGGRGRAVGSVAVNGGVTDVPDMRRRIEEEWKDTCSRHRITVVGNIVTDPTAAGSAIRRSSSSGWPAIRGAAPPTATGSRATRCSSPSTAGASWSPAWGRAGKGDPVDRCWARLHQRVRGPRRQPAVVAGDAGHRRSGPDLARCDRAHREAAGNRPEQRRCAEQPHGDEPADDAETIERRPPTSEALPLSA